MSEEARREVLKVYPGWKFRIKDMTDDQVTAIYLRLKAQGKLK